MESIKKYAERFFAKTRKNKEYGLSFDEMEQSMKEVFAAHDANGAFKVVATLFDFGYAKGYRAALAEMKKKGGAAV